MVHPKRVPNAPRNAEADADLDAVKAFPPGVVRTRPTVILDLNHRACPNRTFIWSVNGFKARSDGLHFTAAGVQRLIAPWWLPRLTRLATER